MIRGSSRAKTGQIGFFFFCQMVQKGVEMDCRSFVFAFKACEQFLGVLEGKSVHCVAWKMGVSTLLVQNGLVHFYGMRGCLGLARQVFDEISERDVVSWTSMIDGYSKHKWCDEAVKLFDSMLMYSDVKPNEVTMIAVLSSCSQKRDLRLGKTCHEYVKTRNVTRSLNLMNAILDMYVKCGCLDCAREIFDTMGVRDVFSWTSMVNGYAKNGELEVARALFNEMPERNVVSWNAMIAGYSQNNQPKEALELFHSMLEAAAFVPMENTLVCVLSACGQLGCLDYGQWIYQNYVRMRYSEISIAAPRLLELDPEDSGVYALLASIFGSGRRWGEVKVARRMMRERRVKKIPGRSMIELAGEFHEFLAGDEWHPQSEGIYNALDQLYAMSKLEDC
ncbi:hypothetical protein OIU77_023924 [Salix suchowensis]|uniref:Pentatricopeptide repeat-containing protein n=1 Tax=Salix suchowensis TaxID=1278906 RepID=A0ABQ9C5N2_9ROSI|nr:hypothetical protein OIU77_023924 [Salix suchowensis]